MFWDIEKCLANREDWRTLVVKIRYNLKIVDLQGNAVKSLDLPAVQIGSDSSCLYFPIQSFLQDQ